ncbi:hypothetical protein V8E55_004133 [Tylopilus felleus]
MFSTSGGGNGGHSGWVILLSDSLDLFGSAMISVYAWSHWRLKVLGYLKIITQVAQYHAESIKGSRLIVQECDSTSVFARLLSSRFLVANQGDVKIIEDYSQKDWRWNIRSVTSAVDIGKKVLDGKTKYSLDPSCRGDQVEWRRVM